MTRHGATPRRQWPDWSLPDIRLPRWPWRRILVPVLAVVVLASAVQVIPGALKQPVNWEVQGDWAYLQAGQVDEALAPYRESGFWDLDLVRIRQDIERLPWVNTVTLARSWPDRVMVNVTEQVPLAVWNGEGLINHRGELFYPENTAQVVAGSSLPALSAPDGRAGTVMNHFLRFSQVFHQEEDRLVQLALAQRGAWTLTFASGLEVRLGQRNILQRAQRVARVLETVRATGQHGDIQAIDARYQHAVAVAWKSGESA